MHVLERPEKLVHYVRLVNVLQDVCSNDSMQVCLHVIKDQVNILVILSLEDILKPARHIYFAATPSHIPCIMDNTHTHTQWYIQLKWQNDLMMFS